VAPGAGINTAVTTIRETIMPQLFESEEEQQHEADDHSQASARRDEQRAILRLCLDEIASETTSALRDAAVAIPMLFAIPSSGAALVTFATPGDPTDSIWSRVTAIILDIVGSKIEVRGLIGRPLACAASGAIGMAELPGGDLQPLV
jgi:hypothetical protein